jgi:hypothetical protein
LYYRAHFKHVAYLPPNLAGVTAKVTYGASNDEFVEVQVQESIHRTRTFLVRLADIEMLEVCRKSPIKAGER